MIRSTCRQIFVNSATAASAAPAQRQRDLLPQIDAAKTATGATAQVEPTRSVVFKMEALYLSANFCKFHPCRFSGPGAASARFAPANRSSAAGGRSDSEGRATRSVVFNIRALHLSANFCKFADRWSALPPVREESPDRTGQPAAESADRGNLVQGVTENNSRKAMVKTRGKSSRRAAAMQSGYAPGSCKTKYTGR